MSNLNSYYLLFPLLSALLYAVGSLGVRAAAQSGGSPWRATLLANILTAVGFTVYLEGSPWPEPPVDLPGVAGLGLLFFLGNVLTVLSLTYGDVSIATPVLASKVIMVVVLVALLGRNPVETSLWFAGALMLIGVGLLQRSADRGQGHHHVGRTLVLSLGAALCFAAFDVGVQMLSVRDGFHRVGPYAVGLAGLLSLLLYPLVLRGRPRPQPREWRFLGVGAGLLALQSLILIYALGHYEDAAGINIVYGSRGLWGLVMVRVAGHWFDNRERERAGPRFRYRVAGAACIAGAIVWSLA